MKGEVNAETRRVEETRAGERRRENCDETGQTARVRGGRGKMSREKIEDPEKHRDKSRATVGSAGGEAQDGGEKAKRGIPLMIGMAEDHKRGASYVVHLNPREAEEVKRLEKSVPKIF